MKDRFLSLLPLLALLPLLSLWGCITTGGGSARTDFYQDYAQKKISYTQAVVAMDVFVPHHEEGLVNDSKSYRVDVTFNRELLDRSLQRLLAGLTARGYRIGGDASFLSVGLSKQDGPYRVAATPDDMGVTREVLPLVKPPFYLGQSLALDSDRAKTLEILYWEIPTYLRSAKEQGKPAELAPLLGTGRLGELLALASFRGADNYVAPARGGGRSSSRGDAPAIAPWLELDLLLVEMQSQQVVWAAHERANPARIDAETALALMDKALKALP
jgi:hypothetical protein